MSADVRSIAALRDWHAHLTGYGESLAEALAGVELELRRGFEWLDEQLGRWQKAVRDCEEDVVQAKADLSARKFTGWDGREPDTTVQERVLRRAKARLEYAEDQVARTRGWIGRLPKLIDEQYRGAAHRLTGIVETDLPNGLAALGRKIDTLEAYAGLRVDTARSPEPPNPPAPLPKREGGDEAPTLPGTSATSAVPQDASQLVRPSLPRGGAGPAVGGTRGEVP